MRGRDTRTKQEEEERVRQVIAVIDCDLQYTRQIIAVIDCDLQYTRQIIAIIDCCRAAPSLPSTGCCAFSPGAKELYPPRLVPNQ